MKNEKGFLKIGIFLVLIIGLQSYTLAEPSYPKETVIYLGYGSWTNDVIAKANLKALDLWVRKNVEGGQCFCPPLYSFSRLKFVA